MSWQVWLVNREFSWCYKPEIKHMSAARFVALMFAVARFIFKHRVKERRASRHSSWLICHSSWLITVREGVACGQCPVEESKSYFTAFCMWSVAQSNPPILSSWAICHSSWFICYYSPLHVECHWIKTSHLNSIGLFSTDRGKRDVTN